MTPAMRPLPASAVWADAVFVSALQRCEHPSDDQIRQAGAAAVRGFGARGCAERVAQEYGDHPETAAARMRWACIRARQAFKDQAPEAAWPRPPSQPGPGRTHAS